MKRNITSVISWLAVAACMAVIFWFSSQNGNASQLLSDNVTLFLGLPLKVVVAIRKAAHFLEFTGLAVLFYNAFYCTFGKVKPFLSFAATAVYALSDEIHQIFVDGRACRLFDFFIDCLGAASGILVLTFLIFIFSKLRRGLT